MWNILEKIKNNQKTKITKSWRKTRTKDGRKKKYKKPKASLLESLWYIKRIFSTHSTLFFITVRCLDFKEAWSYTYTRIRTCSVFSAAHSIRYSYAGNTNEHCMKREYRSQWMQRQRYFDESHCPLSILSSKKIEKKWRMKQKNWQNQQQLKTVLRWK